MPDVGGTDGSPASKTHSEHGLSPLREPLAPDSAAVAAGARACWLSQSMVKASWPKPLSAPAWALFRPGGGRAV